MGLEALESYVEAIVVPPLTRMLGRVRQYNKTGDKMAFVCPVEGCDAVFEKERGCKIHLSRVHQMRRYSGKIQEIAPEVVEPARRAAAGSMASLRDDEHEERHQAARAAAKKLKEQQAAEAIEPPPAANHAERSARKRAAAIEKNKKMKAAARAKEAEITEAQARGEIPEVEPPMPAPAAPVISEIPTGSVICLTGTHWIQDVRGEWVGQECANLSILVGSRYETADGITLVGATLTSPPTYWAVQEATVLDMTETSAVLTEIKSAKTSSGVEDITRTLGGQEARIDRVVATAGDRRVAHAESFRREYEEAVNQLFNGRAEFNQAKRRVSPLEKDLRPIIEEFLKEYGDIDDKVDPRMYSCNEFGVRATLSRDPGSVRIERDLDQIVEWLKEHKVFHCLKSVVDLDAWEVYKATGEVPDTFIRKVEKPIQGDDRYTLRLERGVK